MILYAAQGTSNLGDFFNSFPVLSGISKIYGNITLILQNDVVRFNGIKELISYQSFIDNVYFENEYKIISSEVIIPFNSWVEERITKEGRPMETCRYEIRFKDYKMEFEVDDEFILQIPELDVEVFNDYILGDRCTKTTYDKRRKCGLIPETKYHEVGKYLNYNNNLIYNLNMIKQSTKPFVTTITGISVLVDLMNIPQILLYDDEMENWQDRGTIHNTYIRHYYNDRKSILEKI